MSPSSAASTLALASPAGPSSAPGGQPRVPWHVAFAKTLVAYLTKLVATTGGGLEAVADDKALATLVRSLFVSADLLKHAGATESIVDRHVGGEETIQFRLCEPGGWLVTLHFGGHASCDG
jgi:hypothetical protein